jgi:lactoylglutathione lyase
MHIEHLAIWTDEPETLKDFYTRFFSCKSSPRYVNEKKQFSSYFLTFPEGARLELMKQTGIYEKSPKVNLGLAHFAISLGSREKVDELTRTIGEAGYVIDSAPRITGDGYYESVIRDPGGNRIELTV